MTSILSASNPPALAKALRRTRLKTPPPIAAGERGSSMLRLRIPNDRARIMLEMHRSTARPLGQRSGKTGRKSSPCCSA